MTNSSLMPKNRTIDKIIEAFDLNQRRKFTLKNKEGKKIIDLYFRPVTRANRKMAQQLSNSTEALDLTTQMLCQIAELENGNKAFSPADVYRLQRELPEDILNDLELFLFNLGDDKEVSVDDAKKN